MTSLEPSRTDSSPTTLSQRFIAPRSTRVWQQIVLQIVRALSVSVRRLDRPRAMRLGQYIGRISYRLGRQQRFRANRNLLLVFGDTLTKNQREMLVRQVFIEFGKTTIDFLRAPALHRDDFEALIARVEGFEHVQAAQATGRGIIFACAHLGNWELLGRWIAARQVPLTVVARDTENEQLSQYVRQLREASGMEVLSRGTSARALLRLLRKGEAIGILPDQNRGDVFVPFFGIPCGTPAGPASLALHTGATILPAYAVREPDNRYRIICLPPVPAEPTGDSDADIARVMTGINRALETVVREYPAQWLWLHNRWRGTFEEQNQRRLPPGYDYDLLRRRWDSAS